MTRVSFSILGLCLEKDRWGVVEYVTTFVESVWALSCTLQLGFCLIFEGFPTPSPAGPPTEGPGGGPPASPWATAAAAVGPGGEGGRGDRLGWGHTRVLYKAPED